MQSSDIDIHLHNTHNTDIHRSYEIQKTDLVVIYKKRILKLVSFKL